MVTIHQYWSCSLALVFIFWIEPSGSSPTILRSNGAVADPVGELKPSSCSQQLEKLKMETRRHVSALNAITDNSVSAAWRNRRLLSITLPELKPKSNASTMLAPRALARTPAKTEDKATNSLRKYLSSLDQARWVSECLKGGKCSVTDPPENKPTEKQPSESPGSMDDTTTLSKRLPKIVTLKLTNEENSPVEVIGEINQLANETLLFNVSAKDNETVNDSPNKHNVTKSNRIIDLLPPAFGDTLMVNDKNYKSQSNQSLADPNSMKVSAISADESTTKIDALVEENTNKPIECTETSAIRTSQVRQEEIIDPEPVSLSSLISLDQSSSNPTENYSLEPNDRNPFLFNSWRYLPNTNQLVRYNNHFLPLTIQFTPVTYYQRYPRSGALSSNETLATTGAVEKTFALDKEQEAMRFADSQPLPDSEDSRITEEQVHETGSLDDLNHLVADYGNDLFKRGSTGKRELESSNEKKEAVTTNYPELPSSHPSADIDVDGQIFTRLAPGDNGSDSDFYLIVGGNWVANFKDNPRLLYIQPQSRQLFTGGIENSVQSPQPYNQPSSSTNPNCPSKRILTNHPMFNLPAPPYSQIPYAVDERNLDRSRVLSSVYNARDANEMNVPTMVAARNGYTWYDYDSNGVDSSTIPRGNRKGAFIPKIDDLYYEDALVNFPPQNYEPPVVESHNAHAVKPEEFMEHDINTADMVIVRTQLLTALPLVPTENHLYESDSPSYGKLVADVTSRSSPEIKISIHKDTPSAALTNTAFKAYEYINSPRVRLPNRPDFQASSSYFPPSRPNEFEFVSGQWIKREPLTDLSAQGFFYDQVGQRRIRDIVVARGRINPLSHMGQPTLPFKSKCFG